VSAVQRSLLRDAADPIALRDQIAAFLLINVQTILAKKIFFDFRTPQVKELVVAAIEQALSGAAPFLDEVVVVE
jgi:hypothetical protein